MPIVSNTSPVLNLAIVDLLHILQHQFGQVLVPPAVLEEMRLDTNFPGVDRIRQSMQEGWLSASELANDQLARALRRDLDDGEAEAIALSLQLGFDTVLIDEHDGRSIARSMGLATVGVLGILLRAKRIGEISSVKEALQKLQNEAGFYISDHLFTSILSQAGER
jgi:predicted nucleic acid-binding protein